VYRPPRYILGGRKQINLDTYWSFHTTPDFLYLCDASQRKVLPSQLRLRSTAESTTLSRIVWSSELACDPSPERSRHRGGGKKRNRSHTQTHNKNNTTHDTTRTTPQQHNTRRDKNNTTNNHTKNPPPTLNNNQRWHGDGA